LETQTPRLESSDTSVLKITIEYAVFNKVHE